MLFKTSTVLIYVCFILLVVSFIKNDDKYKYRSMGYFLIGINLIFFLSSYLWIEYDSIVQSFAAVVGGILSLYISIIIALDKKDLDMISKTIIVTVSILGISYSFDLIKNFLISRTAQDTVFILDILGYDSAIVTEGNSTFIKFMNNNLRTEIIMACTGIGTISIFAGLISTIDELDNFQKFSLIILTSSVIYVLNIIRNVFIAASYGGQHLHFAQNTIEILFGRGDEWVSYYIADKLISQPISAIVIGVIALFIFTEWKSKILNEIIVIFRYIEEDYYDLFSSKRS